RRSMVRPALETLDERIVPSIKLNSFSWTPIGPAPASGNVELGHPVGRTEDVVADPADPNVAFLAASDGGIWRTGNWLDPKGPTWTPKTSYQLSGQFGSYHALAVAPSNHLVVYGAVSGPGAEILKSTDGGKTWTPLANAYFEGSYLSSVTVDPTNANVVYAA